MSEWSINLLTEIMIGSYEELEYYVDMDAFISSERYIVIRKIKNSHVYYVPVDIIIARLKATNIIYGRNDIYTLYFPTKYVRAEWFLKKHFPNYNFYYTR